LEGAVLFYCLEELMEVWLLNAAHMKAVPGRKTDVKDAEWIAQLLEHGLLSPSFVPPPEIRHLRMLTRYRVQLMGERWSSPWVTSQTPARCRPARARVPA
jgi:hypothetical protein